ncbi:putative Hemin receptor protein HmuR [Pseudoalteromonas luteoviolacea B = ATCC 29581]|nr:putative Hemin receptor protein HmuR [Pseudoalteromonas luteoviolacea B = ATCC 29581]
MRFSKLTMALFGSALLPTFAIANEQPEVIGTLDLVTVQATKKEKAVLTSGQAINVIDSSAIEKEQISNLFNALDAIPNVSANGGPRLTGFKFNVRGFSDAEDVMVTIDGMVQTFEKYRAGSLLADPELYRSVEVKRGTNTVLFGGGALGGNVSVELKDASDFLLDGEQAGLKVKLGYDSNNAQRNISTFAFAKPTEQFDVLVAATKRDSDDFELSNGETLNNSEVKLDALLLKANYAFNEDIRASFSVQQTEDAQRTEFNTTDVGAWGTVYRETNQDVLNAKVHYAPHSNPHFSSTLSLGTTSNQMRESDGVGMLADFVGIYSDYVYDIFTLDWLNHYQLQNHMLTYGIQWTQQDRTAEKLALPCVKVNYQTYACEQYGMEPAISEMTSHPGGEQTRTGIYVQDEWKLENWLLTAGLRYEQYRTSPTSEFSAAHTNSDTTHSGIAYALGASYQLTPTLNVFANYQDGFRAPLIDELYDQYGNRSPNPDLNIERSDNLEFGIAYARQNLFANNDQLKARALYFTINVDDEILSRTSTATNPLPNPRYSNIGENGRDGIEIEVQYAIGQFINEISYSSIEGDDHLSKPLWYLPADKLHWQSSYQFEHVDARASLSATKYWSRNVETTDRATRRSVVTEHEGYVLIDANVNWEINSVTTLRFGIDNLFDKEHRLIAGTGGAIGDFGIGRNIKTQLQLRF